MLPSFQPPIFAALLIASLLPRHAQAWGDEGHRITGLITEHYLDPMARTKLGAMLGLDLDFVTYSTPRG